MRELAPVVDDVERTSRVKLRLGGTTLAHRIAADVTDAGDARGDRRLDTTGRILDGHREPGARAGDLEVVQVHVRSRLRLGLRQRACGAEDPIRAELVVKPGGNQARLHAT